MPVHKLTAQWQKIASAGSNVQLHNIGQADIDIAKGAPGGVSSRLVPQGFMAIVDVPLDLYARAIEPKAELLTTITLGMPG